MTDRQKLIDIRNQIDAHFNSEPVLPPVVPPVQGNYSIKIWEGSLPNPTQLRAGTLANYVVIVEKDGQGAEGVEVVFELPDSTRTVRSLANGGASVNQYALPQNGLNMRVYLKDFPDVSFRWIVTATGQAPPPPVEPEEKPESDNTVNIGGIVYSTTKIGNQTWLSENLRSTFDIPVINDPTKWIDRTEPACADYAGNASNLYGKLYNFSALARFDLDGWRVPTDADWKQLEANLGMKAEELNNFGHRGSPQHVGGKLKTTGHFRTPITDKNDPYYNPSFVNATNETGFSAVPNGSLNPYDTTHNGAGFYSMFRDADFWSSTTHADQVIVRALSFNRNGSWRGLRRKGFGMGVRLVKA